MKGAADFRRARRKLRRLGRAVRGCLAVGAVGLLLASAGARGGDLGELLEMVAGGEDDRFRAEPFGGGIDQVSQACIQCHDGSLASEVPLERKRGGRGLRGHDAASHPLGTRYSRLVARAPWGYRPAHELSADIRLVDGKVGCASCHRLAASEREGFKEASHRRPPLKCTASGELTAGPTDRELCLSCHVK